VKASKPYAKRSVPWIQLASLDLSEGAKPQEW
jgi:hypothetical protein